MATRPLIVKSPWSLVRWTRRKERNYPWVVSVVFGATTLTVTHFTHLELRPETILRVLSASVILGSITAGFVGTSLAVLSGMGHEFKKRLRRSGYIYDFQSYLRAGLFSGITLALVGILGPIAIEFCSTEASVVAWVAALSYCICCQFRVCRQMFVIFVDPDTHQE